MHTEISLKPMPLWVALLFFGIPSLILVFSIYVGLPFLHKEAGVSLLVSTTLCIVGPLVLLFFASFIAYRLEGRELSWHGLKERFRLKPMTGKAWLWTIGIILFGAISDGLLGFTAQWLIQFPLFAPPEFLPPTVDPRIEQAADVKDFLGVPLLGNWWLIPFFLGILFFNIFGEEFWWRGYILPRQELVHKEWTWVIHGILWTLFHVFWKWNLIILLPTCLALAFLAQKTQNTWPGIIVHFVGNGLALIPMTMGIMGILN